MQFSLNVNGADVSVDVDDDTPLLWVIRDNLKLSGTKFGCGIAACGACTVHIDGVATRTCVLPVSAAVGKKITTIEALSNDNSHPVQQAWLDQEVPQCGYCQSGMIMAVTSLLQQNAKPTESEIDAAITNICRCGTYNRVRSGIHKAVELMASGTGSEGGSSNG
jgi:aerobic-type carbon monoxide dehydrogenase small subunit (CoxS/CutS family)